MSSIIVARLGWRWLYTLSKTLFVVSMTRSQTRPDRVKINDHHTLAKMKSPRFSLIFFIISSVFLIFNIGYLVREFKLFPYGFYTEAAKGYQKIRQSGSKQLPWYYKRLPEPLPQAVSQTGEPQPGLTLVTKIAADRNLAAEIVDLEGNTVHKWDIDWFEMWSNPQHIPENDVPKEKPGTNIHGAVIMDDGDLVFNFESQGLIRLDRDGEVVWRLPYQTHHSVHQDDNGNLWVGGKKFQTERNSRLPNLIPPYYEDTILEVTPEGKIAREYSVADILRKNGYTGLLYLGTLNNESTRIRGQGQLLGNDDILHLNDVEPFSAQMESGVFEPGDVMVSLRNINTVFVFDTKTEKIKFLSTGKFVRQHDPDFIDGNTISVFDNNNNNAIKAEDSQSKIAIVSAPDNKVETYFEGTPQQPFFTNVMGKHQWLDNGNLLITESKSGRGIEVDRQGEIVWEYYNYVDRGVVGAVGEFQRLPLEYTSLFLEKDVTASSKSSSTSE